MDGSMNLKEGAANAPFYLPGAMNAMSSPPLTKTTCRFC